MAYDHGLAERLRALLDERPGTTEKEMFGGLAFLHEGKMFVGIVKDELLVRVGRDAHDAAILEPHARTMDFTGRPMRGYVFVAPEGFAEDQTLGEWVARAAAHVATLPAKRAPTKAPTRAAGKVVKPASAKRPRRRP